MYEVNCVTFGTQEMQFNNTVLSRRVALSRSFWLVLLLAHTIMMTMNSIFCYLFFIICTRFIAFFSLIVYVKMRAFVCDWECFVFLNFFFICLNGSCLSHWSYCDLMLLQQNMQYMFVLCVEMRIENRNNKQRNKHYCKCKAIDRSSDTLSLG